MYKRILETVHRAYPALRIVHAPGKMRERGIIYKFYPSRSAGRRKNCRLEMKFMGESLADALSIYDDVRDLIVSHGDESRVGEGLYALKIEESAYGKGSGYVSKTGLYYIQTSFAVMGY